MAQFGTDRRLSPLRVVLVSHSALPGGHNNVILSLLRHRPEDVECRCVFLEEGPIAGEVEALGVATELIASGRARELWRVPGVLRALRRAIAAHGADVVFAHVSKAQIYCAPAAHRAGVASIWRNPEGMAQAPRLIRLAARLPAQAVVCSSHFTAAELAGRTRADVHIVHPGIEADDVPPARVHAPGAPVFGTVGRLQRWKRIELVLAALPHVLRELPDARLRVIGGPYGERDRGYAGELREVAERLGVASAVEFTGQLPSARGEIRTLDVLVHTALREPFGLVMVEAMQQGVPVVATRDGGPAEIVRDGVDGLLVDETDAGALARALVELGQDPGRRAALGASARERALTEFSATRMSAQLWGLVRGVATDSGAG